MKKYENFCAAYQSSMILDEELWIAALQARNNVTHSYNREIALDIVRQTKEHFYGLFCELKKTVDRHWI